jgi:hypothetical protein
VPRCAGTSTGGFDGQKRRGPENYRALLPAATDRNEDRSIRVGAGAAGFRAVPTIREVRAHYGIAPGEGLTE